MDDTEVKAIAAAVVDQLHESVIPSALPAHIGDWIRATCGTNALFWRHSIPMSPPGYALCTDWRLNPDGSLHLELMDANGQRFWQGTFQPVKEYPTCSLGHPTRPDGSHVRREDKHG